MQNNLIIPAAIRDALVRYLQRRPYEEVHEVMPYLISLAPAVTVLEPAVAAPEGDAS